MFLDLPSPGTYDPYSENVYCIKSETEFNVFLVEGNVD